MGFLDCDIGIEQLFCKFIHGHDDEHGNKNETEGNGERWMIVVISYIAFSPLFSHIIAL